MKSLIKKILPILLSFIFSFIVIVVTSYLFNSNLVWLKLFSVETSLIKAELQAVIYGISSIVLLSLAFTFKGSRILPALVMLPVVTVSIASWFHFEFFRDFIVFNSLLLIGDVANGPPMSAFMEMKSFPIAVFFLVTSFVYLAVIFLLQKTPRFKLHKPTMVIIIFLCAYHSVGREIWYQKQVDIKSVSAPNQMHPFMRFSRSAFVDMTATEINQDDFEILAALDERVTHKDDAGMYSLKRNFIPKEIISSTENVIVIIVESLRSTETGYFGNDFGATPFLDKLAKDNLAFEQFYANSTHTVRGELSVLCGVLDYSSGSPFSKRGKNLGIDCIPKVLSDKGYETFWFHGNDRHFYSRDYFLPEVGFKHIFDKKKIQTAIKSDAELGWGVSDKDVLSFALKQLESREKPFFAEVLTLTNHYPFNADLPDDIPTFDETPEIYGNYLRSLRYTDSALESFWKAFESSSLYENTAVFIVSDHGLTIASAKQENSGSYYKTEMRFRVPMIAVIPNLEHQVNTKQVYSQVDIPATIYDLLGISLDSTYLMGGGIFDANKKALSVSTGFSDYVVRVGDKLCFSDSKKSNDVENIYGLACHHVDIGVFKNFTDGNPNPSVVMPKNYKKIIELSDYFLFNSYAH